MLYQKYTLCKISSQPNLYSSVCLLAVHYLKLGFVGSFANKGGSLFCHLGINMTSNEEIAKNGYWIFEM